LLGLCRSAEKDVLASKGKGHGELNSARHVEPVACIGNIFAQPWKGIALDCVKDAEPLEVLGEDFVKRGERFRESRFIKKY